MKTQEIQSITVIGRKWFENVNGNTYHSVRVLVDGVSVAHVPFEYGYGEHYVQTAKEELLKLGYLSDIEHFKSGGTSPLWSYCSEHDIAFHAEAATVQRKKHL